MTHSTATSASTLPIDWGKVEGLVPAIVQHYLTGEVLMLGYMSPEALEATQNTGQVTFFSRSKNRLWKKGETSGHVLNLKAMAVDCDQDTLLVLAEPQGPVCHLQTPTCFGEKAISGSMLNTLIQTIDDRAESSDDNSYTRALLSAGVKRCAQKVGEEGVEVALAATAGDKEELHNEVADLLYHLLVTLKAADGDFTEVLKILHQRHQPEGP